MNSPGLERAAALILMTAIGVVSVKLSAAQILFGIAAVLWLLLVVSERRHPALPAFAWALLAYAGLTIVSAFLVSPEYRITSLIDLKQLLMFLMVPMVIRLLRGHRAMQTLNVVIAIGAAVAVLGVIEYSVFGFDHLGARPAGSLSHYMTYSGVIMLVLSATVARLLFYREQTMWPAVALPALVVALAATNTRSVWIGAAVSIVVLVAMRRPKLLLFAPVAIALAVVVAPPSMKTRAVSIFDLQDESNRDRLQMIEMGVDIVRDHPWFGVGPEMVGQVYPQYLRPNPVHTYNPHLHNVPMQIAAERGLLALAAWLAFVMLAIAGLIRLIKQRAASALAAAGFGAVLAMLVAGLFEYNFGDSEFLVLFLALITLPFAATATDTGRNVPLRSGVR